MDGSQFGIQRVVYDLGMNNGDDSAYYLLKGYQVVGIDANPEMCRLCEARFSREIRDGRMKVLNVGISEQIGEAIFHVNREKPAISTFEPEHFTRTEWAPREWDEVIVRTSPLSVIMHEHGPAEFIKIDIEFYDRFVLHDLLLNGIRPKYVSAESQEIDIFCLLVALGYERFKLVPGISVETNYRDVDLRRLDGGTFRYSFPYDSSGPFGDDLVGPELDKVTAVTELLKHGLGWIDIHAF